MSLDVRARKENEQEPQSLKDATKLIIEAFKLNKVDVNDGITACMNIFLLQMSAMHSYEEFCKCMDEIMDTARFLWEKHE